MAVIIKLMDEKTFSIMYKVIEEKEETRQGWLYILKILSYSKQIKKKLL